MAHIVPSIAFIQEFRQKICNGNSVVRSLELVFQSHSDPFSQKVKIWWFYKKAGKNCPQEFKSDYQKTLLQIIDHGLKGASIIEHLIVLEKEMLKEFDRQWKAYLESLAFKLMIPLLLFFFPSYVVLLFGPLFIQFLSEVSP